MNQAKIGKFIAERRKEKNLTQMQLAEKLNITDRAVSKWECGRAMPDSSIMIELCDILGISVNDLLCGEIVKMENCDKNLEKILIEMVKQKENSDKRLLLIETIVGILLISVFFALSIFASVVKMEEWMQITLIFIGLAPILLAAPFMLKIEQIAGYYKCQKCGEVYVPEYTNVFFAMHIGRTRFMKCPKCKKYSWNNKVLSKEETK